MVGGFFKAFKSETQRILLTQKSNLDFSELEKVSPSDLAKEAVEEEADKKSASKERKGQKVKKKAISEKPSSQCPGDTGLLQEIVSIEVEPSADNVILVPEDQSLMCLRTLI